MAILMSEMKGLESLERVMESSEKQQGKSELYSELDRASKGVLKIKVIQSHCLEEECNLAAALRTPEVSLAGI